MKQDFHTRNNIVIEEVYFTNENCIKKYTHRKNSIIYFVFEFKIMDFQQHKIN